VSNLCLACCSVRIHLHSSECIGGGGPSALAAEAREEEEEEEEEQSSALHSLEKQARLSLPAENFSR
jgi:hypothetical protein